MKYRKYLRVCWPEYQELMDEHESEWMTEVSTIENDVIVPKEWVIDYEQKILDEKTKLIEQDLIEYFKNVEVENKHGEYNYTIKKFKLWPHLDYMENSSIEIHSLNPVFDEDYDGRFDDDVEKIGLKYDVKLYFDICYYGK